MDVMLRQVQVEAFFKDRGNMGRATAVDLVGIDPADPALGRHREALDLDEEDSGSFEYRRHCNPGGIAALAPSEEKACGISYLNQARLRHSEEAYLVH